MSIKVELPGVHLAEGQYFKDDAGTTWANVLFSKNSDGSPNYRSPIDGIDTADGIRKDFLAFDVNLTQATKPANYVPGLSMLSPATGRVVDTAPDTEPLDIASMNSAFEKQQAALNPINIAAEEVQQAQQARSENANTAPEEVLDTTGRLAGTNTNAIKDPLAGQLDLGEPTDAEFAAAEAEFNALDAPPATPTDTVGGDDVAFNTGSLSNKDGEVFDDGWQPNMGAGALGSTGAVGTGGSGTNTAGDESQSGGDSASPLPSQFLSKITPKSNPLNQYASYTYNVSLYLVNKTGLERLQKGEKTVAGLPLILQSGGASQGTDLYGAKRSPYFNLDYYIDDIEMTGIVTGTSTQSIHNQHTIRFTITEPNGLTFLENLHAAVKDYKTSLGFPKDKINYASQIYLMVIRFRGHQIDGIPESLGEMTNDQNQFSEKYIPFVFTGVRFRVENNKIVYHCEAAAPMSFYNLNSTHAAIPFNIELNGGTVGDVLTANQAEIKQTETQREAADQTAQDNTKEQKSTLYTGLVQALNQNEEKKYGKEFANVYHIEFENGAEFEKKKIVLPGSSTNKNRAPLKSSKQQPQAGATDKINKDSRIKTIQAGTSIVQAIEQIIRSSEYVTSQQMIVIDERTGKPKPADKNNPQPFQWFKVVMQATPRSDKINPKTLDYAYDLVFKIKRYQVGNINSPYFPPPIYRGEHKQYKYWFTGENTEILNFQQDFNYLYFQQVATSLTKLPMPEINAIHVARNFYMPRSVESTDGTESRSGEIAASAAATLYSPGDLAHNTIEIIGDPDWIAQSEIFYGTDKITNNPFEADGSVNFNASEVFYSIEWNKPADYKDTGLLTPERYENSVYNNTSLDPNIKLVYRANSIKTKLSGGQFTQVLEGSLMQWVNDKNTVRTDQGFRYTATKRQEDINKAFAAEQANEDDAFWAEQDAIQEQVNQRSAETMLAEQDAEIEAFFDETEDVKSASAEAQLDAIEAEEARQRDIASLPFVADELDTGSAASGYIERNSTEPPLTNVAPAPTTAITPNPNTSTQNTITNTGGERTVEQSPLVEPTPIQPPTPEPTFPAFRDINPNTLTEGQVTIVRGSGGELIQVRKEADGTLSGIAEQDPETGEWYTI
jgi:hypothetical protein